ncbi:MAG: hypothetical protein J4F97_04565, partial [Pseudomonadales bacterium]|nr:hypothetical protein [Pseudomonadales bacterium]
VARYVPEVPPVTVQAVEGFLDVQTIGSPHVYRAISPNITVRSLELRLNQAGSMTRRNQSRLADEAVQQTV